MPGAWQIESSSAGDEGSDGGVQSGSSKSERMPKLWPDELVSEAGPSDSSGMGWSG